MAIRILAIGKKHEPWIEEGVKRYQKRLRKPFDVEWVLLPHSSLTGLRARQEESEALLKRLDASDYVILLDERGAALDSPAFSRHLEGLFQGTSRVTVIIGGAYGVDENLRQRADHVLSLSKLVFPHQLVRLILIEQLYRAQEIAGGAPYHHSFS